jgi:hypothetical protein
MQDRFWRWLCLPQWAFPARGGFFTAAAVLLGRGRHYAELYNTYFRHQSPDHDPKTSEVQVDG